jgi:hypothetical protein
MKFPPDDIETRYILNCLNHLLSPNNSPPEFPRDINWDKLFRDLEYHHLAAYFYTLSPIFGSDWPEQFRQNLRGENYKILLYNKPRQALVKQILSRLSEQKIEIIVLKGWANIQTIYSGDLSVRFCVDIDIVIDPEVLSRTGSLLRGLGYQPVLDSWPGYSEKYTNAQVYFSPDKHSPLQIGLHWGLFHRPYYDPKQVNINELFSRAIPIEIAGVKVLRLNLEDQIVYTCAHLGLHHKYDDVLYRYYEIGAIIQQGGKNLDWQTVIRRAGQWRCLIPVRQILNSLNFILPGLVPEEILADLNNRSPVFLERFVNWWIGVTKDRPSFDHLLTWVTIPGLLRRFEIAFQDIIPSRGYMMKRYGNGSSKFWLLFYFRRLFRSFHFMRKSQHPDE